MSFWKVTASVLSCALVFCGAAVEAAKPAKKTVKVLGIGNSFLGNAVSYKDKLNKEDPANKLIVGVALIGGCSLEKHWRLVEAHEKNPNDPKGKPYRMGKKKASLKEMLQSNKWDYVTIQQLSNYSDRPETFMPYAENLYKYIKKYCPGAEVVVYETWADRVDNGRLKRKKKSQEQMYKDLRAAYQDTAKKLGGLKMIPVGDAFQEVRAVWKFNPDGKPDLKKYKYPELPDQNGTVCIGWKWRKNRKTGERKIGYDHHANARGRLLAALVWREFFLGTDSRKSKYLPKGVSEADAKVIREAAHKVVSQNPSPGK